MPILLRLLVPIALLAVVVFSAFSSPAHRTHAKQPVERTLQLHR